MRFFAQDSPFVLAIVLLAAWFTPAGARRVRQRLAATAGAAGLVALGVAGIIGVVHYRPRPFTLPAAHVTLLIQHGADSSFPSDHATLAFAVAGAMFAAGAAWGWPLLAFAFVIAFARVFVGAHWPTDVLGGAAIGLVVAGLARWAAPWLDRLWDAIIDHLGPVGSPPDRAAARRRG